MDQIWNRIEEVAKVNNGFIQTVQVEELGISRPMLKNTLMQESWNASEKGCTS